MRKDHVEPGFYLADDQTWNGPYATADEATAAAEPIEPYPSATYREVLNILDVRHVLDENGEPDLYEKQDVTPSGNVSFAVHPEQSKWDTVAESEPWGVGADVRWYLLQVNEDKSKWAVLLRHTWFQCSSTGEVIGKGFDVLAEADDPSEFAEEYSFVRKFVEARIEN
jgi:hypothetical protein